MARAIGGKWIKHLGALFTVIAIPGTAYAQSVLTYHGNADRSGNFVVPALTWERARNIHLDPGFHPQVTGHLYAQPLYWRFLLLAAGFVCLGALFLHERAELWVQVVGVALALLIVSRIVH